MTNLTALATALIVNLLFLGSAYLGFRTALKTQAVKQLFFTVLGVLGALVMGVMLGMSLQVNGQLALGCCVGVLSLATLGPFILGLMCGFNPHRKVVGDFVYGASGKRAA